MLSVPSLELVRPSPGSMSMACGSSVFAPYSLSHSAGNNDMPRHYASHACAPASTRATIKTESSRMRRTRLACDDP